MLHPELSSLKARGVNKEPRKLGGAGLVICTSSRWMSASE